MPQPSRLTLSVAEVIAAAGLFIAAISLFSAMFILPEQVKALQMENEKQDHRIFAIEKMFSEKSEAIARIDERTKRIEYAITGGTK